MQRSRELGRENQRLSRASQFERHPPHVSKMSVENAKFDTNADLFNSYAENPSVREKQVMDLKAASNMRLQQIQKATQGSRHFGSLQGSMAHQMIRSNNRGVKQTFVNMLRDSYEKKMKPAKIIMPWSTDSGMRNLPDRIFSQADIQRYQMKSQSSAVTVAPPPASRPIAKEDIDAGLLETYTLPGSSGYAQYEDTDGEDYGADVASRNVYHSTDSDPYVIPGSA